MLIGSACRSCRAKMFLLAWSVDLTMFFLPSLLFVFCLFIFFFAQRRFRGIAISSEIQHLWPSWCTVIPQFFYIHDRWLIHFRMKLGHFGSLTNVPSDTQLFILVSLYFPFNKISSHSCMYLNRVKFSSFRLHVITLCSFFLLDKNLRSVNPVLWLTELNWFYWSFSLLYRPSKIVILLQSTSIMLLCI